MRLFLLDSKKVDPVLSSKLEELVWDLLKYNKTTNLYKIAWVYKKALDIAEKLQNKYYDYMVKIEKEKEKKNMISQFEIIKEYKTYQKAKRAKSLEKIDTKEFWFPWYEVLYYKIFGKIWISIKLLLKEFKKKYELDYIKSDDIFNFIHFIIIFLIIEYTCFLIYKVIIENITIAAQLSIYYILLNISLLWFIFSAWKFVSKKSLFLSILFMIILYILFYNLKYFFGF